MRPFLWIRGRGFFWGSIWHKYQCIRRYIFGYIIVTGCTRMWLIPSHWWAYGKAKRVFISARNSSEIRWESGEWGEQGSGHVYNVYNKKLSTSLLLKIIEFAHRIRDCQQHTGDLWGWNPRSPTVNLPSDTDVFPCHASRGSRTLRPHCTQKVHLLY